MIHNSNKRGFTLLELLIVVAILAVLGAIVMFVLNPAETLRKTRDSQRISDLSTIKTALALFITSTSSPVIGGSNNNNCKNGTGADTIWYSVAGNATTTAGGFIAATSTAGTPGYTDGAGWIPVNLDALTGGSPISNMPVDPINTVAGGATTAATSTDYVYRYSCDKNDLTFEVDAVLESSEYAGMKTTDGGDNNLYYEVGTKIKGILPTSANPF